MRASWDGALTSRIFVDLEWQVPRCDGASLLRERLTARNASGAEREAATRGQPQPTRRTSAGEFLVRVAYFGDEGAEPWVRLIELAGTRHPHVSFSEVIVQPQAVSALEGRETVAGRRVVYDIVAFAQRLEILQTAPMLIRSSDAVAFVAADADAMNALVASTDGSVRTKRIAQVLADEPTVVSFDALRALLWSERGSTESEP